MKNIKMLLTGAVALMGSSLYAGDVFLTGHDVLLHDGQVGYDEVILDYLRGADAKAGYDIAVVSSGTGFAKFTGGADFQGSAHKAAIPLVGTLAGYGSATHYKTTDGSFAADLAADLASGAIDALVVTSHTSCGGCALTTAGADALEALSAGIATAFNAGMDIYGNSGAGDSTYYNFLPASAVATGASISGSTGFEATAAGEAIGIDDGLAGAGWSNTASDNTNGFATHNRFVAPLPIWTVMETRASNGDVISMGLRGGTIVTTGTSGGTSIVVTTGTTSGPGVPDSGSSTLLLLLGVSALAALRRFTKAG